MCCRRTCGESRFCRNSGIGCIEKLSCEYRFRVCHLHLDRLFILQLEDTGSIVQIGYSTGARSAPTFDWARNIISKCTTKQLAEDLDVATSSVFAMFWNICRAWLPCFVIQDIANFTSSNHIALMDGHHKKDTTYGTYTVNINDIEIEFHDALLAPPLLRSFVNFVTQGYKGTVGSSREFRHLMTKEVYERII